MSLPERVRMHELTRALHTFLNRACAKCHISLGGGGVNDMFGLGCVCC